jgi:adenylate cyclase
MKRYFPAALALAITFLVVGLAWNGLAWTDRGILTSLEMRWLDAKFRWRGGNLPGDEVLIVAIDDRSLDRLGSARLFERYHAANLIHRLAEAGAKVIGFDIVFAEPDPSNAENDRLFAEAIAHAGNVVLAIAIDLESSAGAQREVQEIPSDFMDFVIEKNVFPAIRSRGNAGGRLIQGRNLPDDLPIPILARAASTFGFVNFSTDTEGYLRHQPQFIEWGGRLYPSLDLQLLREYLDAPSVLVTMEESAGGIAQVEVGGRVIPTDRFGRYMINFNGRNGTHRTVSWIDVEEDRVDHAVIRDRIVIIGPKAQGLGDAVPTPFDPVLPGVELHANVIDNILSNRHLTRNATTSAVDMALVLLFGTLVATYLPGLGAMRSIAYTVLALAGLTVFNAWAFIAYDWVFSYVYPGLALVVSGGSVISYKYIFEEREKNKTREVFSRYLDQAVIDQVVGQPDRLKLGGEKQEMTVLFSDVRGFSTFSEKMTPQELVGFLNVYFDQMAKLIFKNLGTLDKLVGDAVMCFWGHPIKTPDHALRATIASLEMIEAVRRMESTVRLPDNHRFDIGIGLSTGEMVVGNMGSQNRFSYTVMGDHVNLGSRLEGLNKFYGTHILISDSTYRAIRHRVFCRELDRVKVKGRNEAVTIYEPLGLIAPEKERRVAERRGPRTLAKKLTRTYFMARHGERRSGADRRLGSTSLVVDLRWEPIRREFEHALALYRAGDFDAADAGFDRVLTLEPKDGPTLVMKGRVSRIRAEQPSTEAFDPVYRFDEK